MDLPPFDNSAMDGYAVRAGDVAGACLDRPVALREVGRVAAGAGAGSVSSVGPGQCARIFTGAQLPEGADAVVMQEDTARGEDGSCEVRVMDAVKPWENVRLRGEDVRCGTAVISAGAAVGAGELALLGGLGIASVEVVRRPRVAVIATGSELLEAGQPWEPGKIFESNRVMVAALLSAAGAEPHVLPLVPDQAEATRQAMAAALEQCDVLITTGGVSVGELDWVRPSFEALGGDSTFWRVAMRPGKPFAHGRWRGKHWFGLPGNPISALVTFLVLARPALRRMAGADKVHLPRTPGRLLEEVANSGTRRHFMRVRADAEGGVRLAGGQGSHMMGALAAVDGLIDVPAGARWSSGTPVSVWRWQWTG
jgi:molybdopterin molybdotransferase